jgi:hypothetical protein
MEKQVHLLVTNCKDTSFLKLYTATVTPAFLRSFDQPSAFLDSSLVIQCAHIPSKPSSNIVREIKVLLKPLRRKKRLHKSSDVTEQTSCKGKKRLRNSSDATEQRPCKRKKQRDGNGGGETNLDGCRDLVRWGDRMEKAYAAWETG